MRQAFAGAGCLLFGCTSLADVDEWPRGAGGASASSASSASGATAAGGSAGEGAGGTSVACAPLSARSSEAYEAAVLEAAPSGYWRLADRADSNVAADAIGSYPGQYVGRADFGVAGILEGNSAVGFDGEGVRIDIGDVLDFDGQVPFTLEAWICPVRTDEEGKFRRIIDKLHHEEPRVGYTLGLQELQSEKSVEISFARWANDRSDTAAHQIAYDDKYHHVVGTFDNGVIRLYVDGVEQAEGTATMILPNTDEGFTIGSNDNGSNDFAGMLDEVAVYDEALVPGVVQAHFGVATAER